MKKDYIYLSIILLLSLALFLGKIIKIEKAERIWKCEKYLSPYGIYEDNKKDSEGNSIYSQKKFTEEQKCYFNY